MGWLEHVLRVFTKNVVAWDTVVVVLTLVRTGTVGVVN